MNRNPTALTRALCILAAVGCSKQSGTAIDRSEADPAEEPAETAGSSTPNARAAWLASADELIQTLERREVVTAEDRRRLAALVATTVWEGEVDFASEFELFVGFLARFKRLTGALVRAGTVDDVAAVGLLHLRAQAPFIRAGESFINQLPADDASRKVRFEGLDKVRLGAAIAVCGLLYIGAEASKDQRDEIFAFLHQPSTYGVHSRQSLQLILATLDETLLQVLPSTRRLPEYARLRAVIEREHAKRPADGLVRVTYQGAGAPVQSPDHEVEIISRTGGYSVRLNGAALAKRVETLAGEMVVWVEHKIELREGETVFEASCTDNQPAAALEARLSAAPELTRREGGAPGAWFDIRIPGRAGAIRVLDIGGRGCFASAEGPAGRVDPARAEAFLTSLRKAR